MGTYANEAILLGMMKNKPLTIARLAARFTGECVRFQMVANLNRMVRRGQVVVITQGELGAEFVPAAQYVPPVPKNKSGRELVAVKEQIKVLKELRTIVNARRTHALTDTIKILEAQL